MASGVRIDLGVSRGPHAAHHGTRRAGRGEHGIDLRVLGCAPRIPLASLERLFPIMWTGFWVNAISGIALFVADATTKGTTTVFMAKIAVVIVAIWVLKRMKTVVYGGGHGAAGTSTGARVLAATSLALWIAAIATGRYMAYV